MPAPDAAAPDASHEPTDPTVDADLDDLDDEDEDEDEDEEIEIPDVFEIAGPITLPTTLVYGEYSDEILFVPRALVDAIERVWNEFDWDRAELEGIEWIDVVPWIAQIQGGWLPKAVVTEFGTRSESLFDGACLSFDPDDADAIVARLTEAGYTCEEDSWAIEFVCTGY